jgi:hypothetical protein
MCLTHPKREECIRLREQDRLSLNEIRDKTGVSKGTLSAWLRGSPLTKSEQRRKIQNGQQRKMTPPSPEPSKFYTMRVSGLTTMQKGKIAEAAVLFRLVLHGLSVYGSPFDGDRTDWLVETPKGAQKVQVKSLHKSSISLRRTNKRVGSHCRYKKGEFDFIVGYCLHSDTAYVYSWKDVSKHQCSISVSQDFAERWDKLSESEQAH